jgi:hypothetical protein
MMINVSEEDEDSGVPVVRLSRNTLITVGAAFGIAIPALSIGLWANSKLDSIDRRLERIEQANDHVMSKPAFESWALRFSRDNPSLKVPEFHQ